MDFDELKEKVKDFLKKNPAYFDRGLEELKRAKICYEDKFDFLNYLKDLKEKKRLSNAYVIPYVLGLTEKIDLSKPVELRQVYEGDSGGLDVDTDISTSGKPKVKAHLEEEYGKDRVLSVGTYMQIGMATAIKDILRKEGVDFKTSNAFCAELDNDLSFEENMKIYKDKFPDLYALYNKYQVLLDFVPKLSNVIRSTGKHAGGVLILPKPASESIPVIAPQKELASAWQESGAEQDLDNTGYMKYDLLGLNTLDIIDDAINLVNEKMYKIIDDDGIEKIVPESYLKKA